MPTAKGAKGRGSRTTGKSRNGSKTPKAIQAESLEVWTPVLVEWEDAYLLDGKERSLDSSQLAKHTDPCIRRICGFLISAGPDRVVTAMDDDRGAKKGDDDCDYVSVIPVGMIKSITPLKELP